MDVDAVSFLAELKRRNVLRVGAAYVVTAWLVVQVAETLFPVYGLSDAVIRIVVNVLAVGLVPVLVLSWVFEWTPDGLKHDAEVVEGAPSSVAAAKRLDRIILVVLALALGYFAFDKFVLAPHKALQELAEAREEGRTEALVESYGDASIAVLAFENMSPDADQAYFADGISEEILNLLAGIPQLRVISRSSAFTYKGRNVPIPQIARELNVVHVLEGSVRKAGDRIRVTAQLIEGHSDTHLWSETWDRTLDDVFAIQDDIASDVVAELQLRLTGAVPTSLRTDPEAYALTLQAKQAFELQSDGYQYRVYELLERALVLDPDYVPALELMILMEYFGGARQEFTVEEIERRNARRRERILAVDPDNAVMQVFDAWGLYEEEREVEAASRLFEEVLTRHPNDTEVLRSVAAFLRRIADYEPAIRLSQHCLRLDPRRVSCLHLLKDVYMWAGQLELARGYMQHVRTLWNEPVRTRDPLLLIMLGDAQGALDMMSGWQDSFEAVAMRAMAQHLLGSEELRDKLVRRYESEVIPTHLAGAGDSEHQARVLGYAAEMYAWIGRLDAAFEYFERMIEIDEQSAYRELFAPEYRPMREDPRWNGIRERLGLDAARLDAVTFEIPPTIPPAEPRLGLE